MASVDPSVAVKVSVLLDVKVFPLEIDKLPSAMIILELAPSGAFSSLITPLNCDDVVEANCDNGLVVRASPPPVPAPMAVLNDAESKRLAELSALTRRNVMEPGLAKVTIFRPIVVELTVAQMSRS